MNLVDLIDENGKLVIPDGVTMIGSEEVRHNDDLLTSVEIPDSVTAVEIPDTVTKIGDNAFEGCSKLISVTIPDSVTIIGEGAFADCESLSSIIVSENNARYKSIDNCCLSKGGNMLIFGCKNSKIPDCVTIIGDSAFDRCTGLSSIEIPSSVTQIGDCAFADCTGLTSIEIPNSVTEIGDFAFDCCTGLTSIEIPNSVTEIGNAAFSGCTGLKSIEIPAWLVEDVVYIFEPIENLSSITIRLTEKLPDNAKDVLRIVDHCDPSIVTLKVPAGCGEAYRHHPDFEGKFKEILEVLD
jgi:hypothetical protein